MDKFVEDLKKIIVFKDTTQPGDIVLIAAKNPQLLAYALVTSIERDITKRDEWWHVTMQVLTVPPQEATWILRTAQMTGMEIFTMDGEQRFVKALDFGGGSQPEQTESPSKKVTKPALRRIK